MKKVQILAVCSHAEILATIIRLINNHPDWEGTPAADETAALNIFKNKAFNVVLLGSGMDVDSESRLKPAFLALNPSVKFVQHYGGGSGLLTGEICQALGEL